MVLLIFHLQHFLNPTSVGKKNNNNIVTPQLQFDSLQCHMEIEFTDKQLKLWIENTVWEKVQDFL